MNVTAYNNPRRTEARSRSGVNRQSSAPSKTCVACGRAFHYRRKWRTTWAKVRYCSARCRRSRGSALDQSLEAAIVDLLRDRSADATICPSEAARRLAPDHWRSLLPATRNAARRLVSKGVIQILQKGAVIDPTKARGPIRLRLC